jgi:hypothetical protein
VGVLLSLKRASAMKAIRALGLLKRQRARGISILTMKPISMSKRPSQIKTAIRMTSLWTLDLKRCLKILRIRRLREQLRPLSPRRTQKKRVRTQELKRERLLLRRRQVLSRSLKAMPMHVANVGVEGAEGGIGAVVAEKAREQLLRLQRHPILQKPQRL